MREMEFNTLLTEVQDTQKFTKNRRQKNGGFAEDNPNNVDVTSISEIHKTKNDKKSKPSSIPESLDSFRNKITEMRG